MEIYIAEIGVLKSEDIFLSMQEKIPKERRESIEKCRRMEDKCRSLGAGLLLEYGLNRLGCSLLSETELEYVVLETGENGKPYLKDRGDICFNLSHSGDYVAAVFDRTPVGIDIEEIKNDGRKVAKRFFREEEQRYLEEERWQNCREQKFTELWTRKESYIKAVGGGMKIPLDSFSVLEDMAEGNEGEKNGEREAFFFRTYTLQEGYCLSVCAGTPIKTEPQRITFL